MASVCRLGIKLQTYLSNFDKRLSDAHCLSKLETVKESRKNQNFHFDLQIHPTLLNSTYLHCQMTGFIPIRVQNFQNVE